MTNKLSLEIEVIDNGRIKVKQFADETKRAVEGIRKTTSDFTSASEGLREQFEKLTSTIRAKKAFEELASDIEKVKVGTTGFITVIGWAIKILRDVATAIGIIKLFEEIHSNLSSVAYQK